MAACLALFTFKTFAAVLYVDVNGTNPTPPYADWSTAATNIQDAVDISTDGDQIFVTNGIYQTGGRVVDGFLTNRVAVTKAITVQSVNGPAFTTIQGYRAPGTTNDDTAVRCVYLANNAVLVGFTLTNGATRASGDSITEQSGGGAFGESASSVVSGCVIAGNSAYNLGGGAMQLTLNNCTLTANSSANGGGGGAANCTIDNCAVTGNSAVAGGGAFASTLNNCTLTGNFAGQGGGLDITSVAHNCIIYYNNASSNPNYWLGFTGRTAMDYCCTTPDPGGTGNISTPPQLLDSSHISADSPCRGAGSADDVSGTDIDGDVWLNPPAIGCDEYYAGSSSGPLTVTALLDHTTAVVGETVGLSGTVIGHASTFVWNLGDGTIVTNQLGLAHSWATEGDYPVTLTAFNDNNSGGVSVTVILHILLRWVHFVATNSTNSAAPYQSWDTAATNIQDAVDAAADGDEILVSNGVYQVGGTIIFGQQSNRVAIAKAITVQSVNGPDVTVIQGNPANDDTAVRCVYLADNATLIGFTLTQGATRNDGDLFQEQSGGGIWCESTNAVVNHCVLTGNLAGYSGGGAYGGTLTDCALAGNLAYLGGGAEAAVLNHCILTTNLTGYSGGGADSSTLNNCALATNSAGFFGGGANQSTLNNCTLTGNSTVNTGCRNCDIVLIRARINFRSPQHYGGGGAAQSTLNNCVLTANSTVDSGGGANASTLNNCTFTENSAAIGGGGADACDLDNCIVFYNSAPTATNYSPDSTLNFCCTTPLPGNGAGNIIAEPQLTDSTHLSAGSPCRAAGNRTYTTGVDIDGEAWADPPSIGCDEYYSGAITGPLSIVIQADNTNVARGFAVNFNGYIDGHAAASFWDFGDGTVISNRLATAHGWASPGVYTVTLTAVNDSYPGGVSAMVTINAGEGTNYVRLDSTNPVPPYASWDTAATNIQDAVDAVFIGGTVLVSNGVYSTGARIAYGSQSNRVAVTKSVIVQSLNGPAVTTIQGNPAVGEDVAVRCVYLTNNATLTGFTLTQGATTLNDSQAGGGVFCESVSATVSNCVLVGNSAVGAGGGACGGTLNNCVLYSNTVNYYDNYGSGGGASTAVLNNCLSYANSAGFSGGGADNSTLNNSTLVNNSAEGPGPGTFNSTLNNCIIYYNNGDNYDTSTLNYCCTTPDPGGIGNITNDPDLVDPADNDFHLQTNSPCINSGNNAFTLLANDLDNNPRIKGGTVDVGAYEYQAPASVISYAWLQQYGFPTDGSADHADTDGDGFNNWQEWRTGTDPTNPLSLLKMTIVANDISGITIAWQSGNGIAYFIQRSTDLTIAFSTIQTNITGQPVTTSYTDTTATNDGPYFYRVGVQ